MLFQIAFTLSTFRVFARKCTKFYNVPLLSWIFIDGFCKESITTVSADFNNGALRNLVN